MAGPVETATATATGTTPAPGAAGPTRDRSRDTAADTLATGPPEVDWEALARSFVHPLRISILELLGIDGGRVLSPNEIRLELQVPLARANHHARALADAGLIELVRTQDVRGAVEHFYRVARSRRDSPT